MKPNQPINKLGSCKGCRPIRKETIRLHKAEMEQCGGKPKSTKVTIPDPAPTVKLQRPLPDPGPGVDQVKWVEDPKATVDHAYPEPKVVITPKGDLRCDSPRTPDVVHGLAALVDYHCTRCDEPVVDKKCGCEAKGYPSPSPWVPKQTKPTNLWKWAAIVLFLLLAFSLVLGIHKIKQQQGVIEFQQELFEKLEEMELPQGDGTIQSPGVLPEKPVNPGLIINC